MSLWQWGSDNRCRWSNKQGSSGKLQSGSGVREMLGALGVDVRGIIGKKEKKRVVWWPQNQENTF